MFMLTDRHSVVISTNCLSFCRCGRRTDEFSQKVQNSSVRQDWVGDSRCHVMSLRDPTWEFVAISYGRRTEGLHRTQQTPPQQQQLSNSINSIIKSEPPIELVETKRNTSTSTTIQIQQNNNGQGWRQSQGRSHPNNIIDYQPIIIASSYSTRFCQ